MARKTQKKRKACRTCGEVKSLDAYAPHASSKDGRRHDCRSCVNAQRAEAQRRNSAKSDETRARDAAAKKQPAARVKNHVSVAKWQSKNPEAVRRHAAVARAKRRGELPEAAVCEVDGCALSGECHHHDAGCWTCCTWLCRRHHALIHHGHLVTLKSGEAIQMDETRDRMLHPSRYQAPQAEPVTLRPRLAEPRPVQNQAQRLG